MDNKITCEICNRKFKHVRNLANHLRKHKIGSFYYYTQVLKCKYGRCKLCNNRTKFINLSMGFEDYCIKHKKLKPKISEERLKERKIEREKTSLDMYYEKERHEEPCQLTQEEIEDITFILG